ncbi:MAG: ABC transporter ATP-binding protein/permease [Actinomycetia bacterium]|nr:ABC transporter ATP-binding protein/permease [Actinomycetes bacterium]
MLQLKDVTKSYKTAGFEQRALDGLSVTFRENEFAAILGPSGSGKTTLLNIIGGLDHPDAGDLVIDGISTQKYRDRDWDTYRNNRIGFVFQSYNLIPHQTVLANVELALTLSGVHKSERQRRAKRVLADVGLTEHINKKPSQLSGGQMQRVAIARALVNNPDILLADEPTGALDSKTSLQVMDILKKVANDRLVIMVTHNAELADNYANRIVNLSDGRVVSDSNPYAPATVTSSGKDIHRTAMSFLTSLSLSLSNLLTKKGRTIMTALAGSIGIIGIAAILSVANGVNAYIANVEEETLSQYPLTISRSGIDLTALMVDSGTTDSSASSDSTSSGSTDTSSTGTTGTTGTTGSATVPAGHVREVSMLSNLFSSVSTNDLASLKQFLDDDSQSQIAQYVNAIEYSYDLTPQIYLGNTSSGVYQANPGLISRMQASASGGMSSTLQSSFSLGMTMSVFSQLPNDSSLYENQYDVLAGRWPEAYNECVLVLGNNYRVSDYTLYTLGLRDPAILQQMIDDFSNQKEVVLPANNQSFSFQEFMNVDLRLVPAAEYYSYDSNYDVYVDRRDDTTYMSNLVAHAEPLHIVGVVGPAPDSTLSPLSTGVNYTPQLISYLMQQSAADPLVQKQLDNPGVDVFTGKTFEEANQSQGQSNFDMSKLLTIDTSGLSSAFNLDSSSMGSINFSNLIDPTSLLTSLPAMPSIDLASVLAHLDLSTLPMAGLTNFATSVLTSYLTDRMPDLATQVNQLAAGYQTWLGQPSSADPAVTNAAVLMAEIAPAIDATTVSALTSAAMTDFLAWAPLNAPGFNVADTTTYAAALQLWMAQPYTTLWFPAVTDTTLTNGDVLLGVIGSSVDSNLLMTALTNSVSSYLSDSNITIDSLTTTVAADFTTWLSDPTVAAAVQSSFAQNVDLTPFLNALSAQLSAYLQQAMTAYMMQFMTALQAQLASGLSTAMGQLSSNLSSAMNIDPATFAQAFKFNLSQDDLAALMMSMMNRQTKSLDGNLKLLGYADPTNPSQISIYPKDFVSKQSVLDILNGYNQRMKDSSEPDKVVVYTDIVGALMSSVTDIVNMISYVLIAFVAISLVVSSIMIGIVTYISVLERKKEIGILRSIGASKGDIAKVFNSETLLIGLVAGIIGISATLLLSIPANIIVYNWQGVRDIAQLPLVPALILIGISCLLSLVAGIIPSAAASRRDPVEALRSE